MYPNKPDTFLTVDGVDLFDLFKMVLVDGYTMPPPSPKMHTVDIPGGNGVLDLSESLFGDVAYSNRAHKYTFYIFDVSDPDQVSNDIVNFLHGKNRKYVFSLDPAYTYTGRFTVTDIKREPSAMGLILVVEVSVDTEPFKKLPDKVIRASAMGGTIIRCPSGRMPVHPTIETSVETTIVFEGQEIVVPAGTWSLPKIIFRQGVNDIYVDTYPIYNFHWSDSDDVTWGYVGSKPIYQLSKEANTTGGNVIHTWDMLYKEGTTWPASQTSLLWSDWSYISLTSLNVADVYLTYEWGDL